MKKCFYLFLFLALYSVNSNAQAQLSGRVTNADGEALVGASVVLTEQREGTFTNAEGRYRFEGLTAGEYNLKVTYVGYEVAEGKTKVPEDYAGLVLVHFQLNPSKAILDEVVVKATRAGEDAPFTASTLERDYLESQSLGQDIPIVLDATPSVVVNSDAGAGIGYTGLRIRGTDPTRINVTINGIPLNDAESQGVFWVNMPDFINSVEDIQVQRGVGTSTNGAAAFGATINLNTSKLNAEPYGEFAQTFGSFGTLRSTVKGGTGLLGKKKSFGQGFSIDGRASRIVSDGYIDRAEVDLQSLYFSAAYFGESSSLRANVFTGSEVTYQAWNGVPAQYVDDSELRKFNVSGTERSGEPHDNEVDDYDQTHAQLLYAYDINANLQLNLAGHYTYGEGFFEQYKAGESLVDYGLSDCDTCQATDLIRRRWLDNHFYGATWSLAYATNGRQFESTLGGAWNQYVGDHFGQIIWTEVDFGLPENAQYYFGTGDKTDFNIFSKNRYSFTPYLHGFVDLQYRRVAYKIDGTDNDLRETNADVTYNFFNPKLGLTYEFSEKGSAYASFAVANREPNRNDFTDAAPGMQPQSERLLNTEAGVKINNNGIYWSANVYHMKYQDQLVLTGNINDVGAAIRVNVPDSYRLGLEMEAGAQLTERFHIYANANLSRNKIQDFTEFRDNWDTGGQDAIEHGTTDIAFSPSAVSFGRVSYDVLKKDNQNLTASFIVKNVGEQFIDNTSNENAILEAYTVGGFQLQWKWQPEFVEEIGLNLLVNNLFDTQYSANAWSYRYSSEGYDARPDDAYVRLDGGSVYNMIGFYPQAGRNFLLGLTVKI